MPLKPSHFQYKIHYTLTSPLQYFLLNKFGEMIFLKQLGCLQANFESSMILLVNTRHIYPKKRKTEKECIL